MASSIVAFIDAADLSTGHLIAWSDSCSGQNKNFYLLCLWQLLIKNGRFTTIDHKFPESGHSYMDSDRDFGLIEKRVREVGNIYSIDQHQDIMGQSQVKSKPHITRMPGNLYDVKELPAVLGLVHRNTTTSGEQVQFRDRVQWIHVTSFGSYSFRETFDEGKNWKTVNLLSLPENHGTTERVKIADCCERIVGQVKKAKLDDIEKQLAYIPEIYKPFYNNLIAEASATGSGNEDTGVGETIQEPLNTRSGKYVSSGLIFNLYVYIHIHTPNYLACCFYIKTSNTCYQACLMITVEPISANTIE